MTISITLDNLTDYADIPTDKMEQVQAWLNSINATLTARYGDLPSDIAAAVYDIVGQAITERLDRLNGTSPDPRIKSQSIAGASVEYFPGATGGYFTSLQLADLDELLGGGNLRSVRTPAPDAIRYGNLLRADWTAEGLPVEAVI